MKAYRIGRVELPWANLTPPIARTYIDSSIEKDTTSSNADSEAEWGDSTLADSAADVVTTPNLKHIDEGQPISVDLDARDEEKHADLKVPNTCLLRRRVSREEYIADLEQKEIDSDILAYPSLDCQTQQAITKEYQALHERITREGFYTCRYSEYGKDSIRLAVLFAAFAFALSAKWYLTSAVFLGLFWVGHDHAVMRQSDDC